MPNVLEQYLSRKADIQKIPLRGAFELSPLCNLNCKMCYIRHTKEEADREGGIKPADFWLSLIPDLKKAGSLFINLIGGEPFIYPGIEQLYSELCRNGLKVTFTTNGLKLAERIPEWLLKNKPYFVIISLYGASNLTYEKLCSSSKGFDLVKKALDNLKLAGIKTQINLNINPENIHEIDSMFAFAREYAEKIDCSSYLFPPSRKSIQESNSFQRFSPAEAAEIELRILANNSVYLDQFYEYCSYLSEETFSQNSAKHSDKFWCKAGVSSFWINWKGVMTGCGMFEEPGFDIAAYGFEKSWELLKESIPCIDTCKDCASCDKREICHACPAMMVAETGSFSGKPEYLCKISEGMISVAGKIIQKKEALQG